MSDYSGPCSAHGTEHCDECHGCICDRTRGVYCGAHDPKLRTPMPRRHPAVTVLGWLMAGRRVRLDGRDFELHDGEVCTIVRRVEPGKSWEECEEVLISTWCTLSAFIKLCERENPDDLFVQGCQFVLEEQNR